MGTNKYRVQVREMSADVIEENVSTDPNKEKWIVSLIPTKGRFDNRAHDLCKLLNSNF